MFPYSELNLNLVKTQSKSRLSPSRNTADSRLLKHRTIDAIWSKSDAISANPINSKNKTNQADKPGSQPTINFVYSRNYYDFIDQNDMLFTKISLKELFVKNRENKLVHKLDNTRAGLVKTIRKRNSKSVENLKR